MYLDKVIVSSNNIRFAYDKIPLPDNGNRTCVIYADNLYGSCIGYFFWSNPIKTITWCANVVNDRATEVELTFGAFEKIYEKFKIFPEM